MCGLFKWILIRFRFDRACHHRACFCALAFGTLSACLDAFENQVVEMKKLSVRRLIPAANFLVFLAFHYLLVLGHVPAKNQIPATLGATSLTAMTLAMVLAARFSVLDWLLDGPGRSYRLHRWLGYAAIAPMIGHWILATPFGAHGG